jgi:ATP-dependent helicase Lhr and Lhr-like helicase
MATSDILILKMLNPAVQYAIKKKWREIKDFRPVQKEAIPLITQGRSCLIVSPTAGGKTEAAILPVLSNIYEAAISNPGIHLIYIAPLKALLNDLHLRFEDWLLYLEGVTVFKWHGDVSVYQKSRQKIAPASILLTTPESLDVMLSSHSIDKENYFSNVSAVIIDEAHYFAADSRGAQLASSLERLQGYAVKQFQRIGLSATVGDPEKVAEWLKGSNSDCHILKVSGAKRDVTVKHVFINENQENYPIRLKAALKQHTKFGKTIIFGNSKKDVELTAKLLIEEGIPAKVHHGSISKVLREEAENYIRDNKTDGVICATSTLELGIDIGDLERVIQKGVLPSVNSYMQRIGRAGRRGTPAEIILVTTDYEDFVLNKAISKIGLEDFCEPLRPSQCRYDILFQQLLLEILSNSGIAEDTFYDKIKMAYPFKKIKYQDFIKILNVWIDKGLILKNGKSLIVGTEIENKFSHKNYMEIYSVFEANENYTVIFNDDEIGYLENWFVLKLIPEESIFQLAGRKWSVLEIENEIKKVFVKPIGDALPPEWRGGGFVSVEYEVARKFHDILNNFSQENSLSDKSIIESCIKSIGFIAVKEGQIRVRKVDGFLLIDTYAGSLINTILTYSISEKFPMIKMSFDYYRVSIDINKKDNINEIIIELSEIVDTYKNIDYNNWVKFIERNLFNYKYSKFSEFIPVEYSAFHAIESFYCFDQIKKFASLCGSNCIINGYS